MILPVLTAIFQNKANKAEKRAQQAQREQQAIRAARERRDTIRATRMAAAQAEQNAESQNVYASSGALGGQGSILTQGNANLNYLAQQVNAANQGAHWLDKAAQYQQNVSFLNGVRDLALQFAGAGFGGGGAGGIPQIPGGSQMGTLGAFGTRSYNSPVDYTSYRPTPGF